MGSSPSRTLNLNEVSPSERAINDSKVADGLTSPAVDELVVALGAATRGRPHHRIGDRYSDLKALGRDVENPAGVTD